MTSPRVAEESDLAPPYAASLTESLRAFGYDLATALADLADNSIFHHSKTIDVYFHWAGESSIIALADDGVGMDEATLVNAMRLGSRNPRDLRDPRDLGRFGLGLKTASFSQCRRVTVFTKQSKGPLLTRCWDIDHIAETNEWRLLRCASHEAEKFTKKIDPLKHGTIVVWEKLDRLTEHTKVDNDTDENAFLRRADEVREHFAAVFHRLMEGKGAVVFRLNGKAIAPWDPFLISEPATQPLQVEKLSLLGSTIEVKPFVLPHLSKIQPGTHRAAAGTRGWNAHQGFYIYRNQRLLVAGDWLGIKGWRQEEHYKLARIRVDLPNSLDHAWEIDVTKSKARPPEALKRELARIGERTRSVAKHVYSHRGAKLLPLATTERVFMWDQTSKHGRVLYRINREHPLVQRVRSACQDVTTFSALMRMIEETVPVPLITITDREKPDQTSGPFETSKSTELLDVMRKVHDALRSNGLSEKDSFLRLSQMDPFQYFPELLQSFQENQHL